MSMTTGLTAARSHIDENSLSCVGGHGDVAVMLQLRSTLGSEALLQPCSVLMSMVQVTNKGRVGDHVLCYCMKQCGYLWAIPFSHHGPHWSEWPALPPKAMVISGPVLPPRTTSGSVVILQLGSALMSMAHVTTEVHGVSAMCAATWSYCSRGPSSETVESHAPWSCSRWTARQLCLLWCRWLQRHSREEGHGRLLSQHLLLQ